MLAHTNTLCNLLPTKDCNIRTVALPPLLSSPKHLNYTRLTWVSPWKSHFLCFEVCFLSATGELALVITRTVKGMQYLEMWLLLDISKSYRAVTTNRSRCDLPAYQSTRTWNSFKMYWTWRTTSTGSCLWTWLWWSRHRCNELHSLEKKQAYDRFNLTIAYWKDLVCCGFCKRACWD